VWSDDVWSSEGLHRGGRHAKKSLRDVKKKRVCDVCGMM